MSGTRSNHERKVNKTHSWERIHGPVSKPPTKRVNADKIDLDELIFLFLGTARSMAPTSSVIHRIIEKYECSDYVAGKIYDRGLEHVKQEWFLVGNTSMAIWIRKETNEKAFEE